MKRALINNGRLKVWSRTCHLFWPVTRVYPGWMRPRVRVQMIRDALDLDTSRTSD